MICCNAVTADTHWVAGSGLPGSSGFRDPVHLVQYALAVRAIVLSSYRVSETEREIYFNVLLVYLQIVIKGHKSKESSPPVEAGETTPGRTLDVKAQLVALCSWSADEKIRL